MTKQKTHHEKHKGFPLLKLALGAALAAGAGYYFTHKEEVDKEARKKIEVLAKLFEEKRAEVEKRVKEVWGEVSKEAVATYMDLRGQLLHELEKENLKKRGKMLKEQYDKVVEDVIRRAKKSGLLTPEVEGRLEELFKMDWAQVKKMMLELMITGVQKTSEMVKKMKTAKKVRTVRKTVKAAAKVTKKTVKKGARLKERKK